MASSDTIRTYFDGTWHTGNIPIMRAADHGAWLGTTVFDGARYFDGSAPDLLPHCQRVNASARALDLEPSVDAGDMVDIVREGIKGFADDQALYIRPMYWAIDGDQTTVAAAGNTGFALCIEAIPFAPAGTTARLARTRFRRPVLEDAVTNAKAGCLYPNNARMLREVRARGYDNALVADAMGNVAETATSNIFMVKDGEVFTPVPNGTFLAGITRARHISNLRADGITVHETVLTFADFEAADEIFMSGNMSKVTPVTGFEGSSYQVGPMARRVREMYWDWATSERL